jgi:hypothetical protein
MEIYFMKKIIFSISLLFGFSSYSQLFVSSNSYMYVGNSYVFVKQQTQLQNNSSILLRRDSQFLQGISAASANSGQGKLSVFQEGSVSSFGYNYWCSPVGNASGSIGNENFGITMLEQPTTVQNSTPVTILAMNVTNGVSSPLSIAPYWIYKFLSSDNYSQWFSVGAASTIGPGEGFTMKGTGGTLDGVNPGEATVNNPGAAQRYDFRGKPNNGDISITVANGKWTLTGNPYPSAIDLSAFLTDATNTTGVAYFWEHDKTVNSHLLLSYRGGYGTFSPVSRAGTGIYIPAVFYSYDISGNQLPLTATSPNNSYARYFSPIGQGFMVEGNASGTSAIMKNSYRVFVKENSLTSVFERTMQSENDVTSSFLPNIPSVSGFDYTTVSTLEVPQIRLNALLNGQAIKQFVIAFDDEATDGMDRAKDAKNANLTSNDVNFMIGNNECVLNVLQFDENKRLPVVVKASENVSFKIQVSDIVNFNPSQNVYLFDSATNIYHDIKNEAYEFVLPQGVYNNRYEITFRNQTLSNNENIKNSLVVFQNNSSETLFVSNPNLIDIASISLYDINGKKIVDREKLLTESEYRISTSGLSDSIYIVEVSTKNNGNFSQKIIVSQAK